MSKYRVPVLIDDKNVEHDPQPGVSNVPIHVDEGPMSQNPELLPLARISILIQLADLIILQHSTEEIQF